MAAVTFIIADHDLGKTSRLIQVSKTCPQGSFDGYACVKRFSESNTFLGYDFIRLSNNEKIAALTLKDRYKNEFMDFFVFGPFVFSLDAFDRIEKSLLIALEDPMIKTILLDEVGQVELMDMGFAWILKEILKSDKTCILCVNTRFVDNVIHHFKITTPRLIKVTQEAKI